MQEDKKRLNSLRQKAVREAWRREKALILQGLGTVDWTKHQQRLILQDRSVPGYEGQHMKSVMRFPQYAGDPNNIQFLTHEQHVDAHNTGKGKSGYRSPTNGYYDPASGIMYGFGNGRPKVPPVIKLSALCAAAKEAVASAGGGQNRGGAPSSGRSAGGAASGTGQINTGGRSAMAAKVDKRSYMTMITALQRYAADLEKKTEELQSITKTCTDGLGDEDAAVSPLNKEITSVVKKYYQSARLALQISKDMQDELDHMGEEDSVWEEDGN